MWWFNSQAKGMKEDPRNHTLWKHKLGWHNRRTMWDNLVIEQAQNDDWMKKRSEKSTVEDKRKFVTCAQDKMKLCIFHRRGKEGSKAKRAQSKAPRNLRPADSV